MVLLSDVAHSYKGKKSQNEDFDNASLKDLVGKKNAQVIDYKSSCGSDYDYFKETNFKPVNLNNLNVSLVDFCNMFDPQYCELISPCKPCTFRELQKWPECQATGYRLIKKCDEISNFSPSENKHEWGSSTEVCFPET